jgi:hypothetical protein
MAQRPAAIIAAATPVLSAMPPRWRTNSNPGSGLERSGGSRGSVRVLGRKSAVSASEMPPSWRRPPVHLEGNMAGPRGTRGTVEAGPEFAARLPVVVVPRYSSSLDGSTNTAAVHRGTLLVPRWMPASRSAPKKASPADRAALLPLLRAHQEALAALEKSTDLVDAQRLERLSRTFAALMAQLQAMARLQVHRVELSPKTVGHLLPAGHPCPGGAEHKSRYVYVYVYVHVDEYEHAYVQTCVYTYEYACTYVYVSICIAGCPPPSAKMDER